MADTEEIMKYIGGNRKQIARRSGITQLYISYMSGISQLCSRIGKAYLCG
jgi:hypothetical protein